MPLWRGWHLKWGKEVESRAFPLRQEERLPEREIKGCRELGRQLCAWTEQETGKQGHGGAKPGSLNASQGQLTLFHEQEGRCGKRRLCQRWWERWEFEFRVTVPQRGQNWK